MRELRHDFRHYYHCAYDEVPTEEAVDLVLALPNGTLYRGALDPHDAWGNELRAIVDVEDVVWKFLWMKSSAGTTDGAPRVPRPWDATERARVATKSGSVRQRLENTQWEEVDHG